MHNRLKIAAVGAILLVGLGLLLYTPWEPVPYDITDYSELLPVLTASDSFVESVAGTVDYYASQGRSNLVTSTFIAANWSLLGHDPVSWRLLRAGVLGAAIFCTLLFVSRFGIGARAAVLGAALLVVAPAATANWLRLTGEPLALIVLLGLLSLCLGFQASERWRWHAAGIWALSVVVVLVKEVMVAVLPLALVLALTWDEEQGGFRGPRIRARERFLLAGLAPAVAAVSALVALVAAGADPTGYSRTYGSGALGPSHFLTNFFLITLPLTGPDLMLSATNLAFGAILVAGWTWKLANGRGPASRTVVRLAAILSVPVAGALIYVPWRRFEDFYALPFQLGSVLLLAVAVDNLEKMLPPRRWLATLLVGAVLLAPAVLAHRTARHTAALRRVNRAVADALPSYPTRDSFFVAVHGLPEQAWQGRARTFARFSEAVHGVDGAIPPANDKTCSQARSVLEKTTYPMIMITYQHLCGAFPRPTKSFRQEYSYLRLAGLRTGRDTVRADILVR